MDDELFYSHLLKTTSSQIERFLWSVKEESSKRLPATNINDLQVLTQNDNSRTHTWLTADWLEQKKNNSLPYKRTANMNTVTGLNEGNKETKKEILSNNNSHIIIFLVSYNERIIRQIRLSLDPFCNFVSRAPQTCISHKSAIILL